MRHEAGMRHRAATAREKTEGNEWIVGANPKLHDVTGRRRCVVPSEVDVDWRAQDKRKLQRRPRRFAAGVRCSAEKQEEESFHHARAMKVGASSRTERPAALSHRHRSAAVRVTKAAASRRHAALPEFQVDPRRSTGANLK